jgi:hypothetical protein
LREVFGTPFSLRLAVTAGAAMLAAMLAAIRSENDPVWPALRRLYEAALKGHGHGPAAEETLRHMADQPADSASRLLLSAIRFSPEVGSADPLPF